jgi:hypothetical protein
MKPLAQNSMIQNRYLVVQLIGKGGMGEVYLAIDQRLGSAVALKRTYFKGDETMGTAFEREARILGRLRHPVLPKVIDHFLEGGDQFLVMEHISGDDLGKRLETSKKPFPLNWVMFWADQALDALNYLHSHEPPIIHRDIKPQNLKLTDENHIVLLDFGLSKDFDSVNTGGSSGVGSIVGYSPGFAPMEQVRGTGTDGRSDLYSLSATLYQLLSNVAPPDALARADAMLGGTADPLEPLNLLNRDVSPAISDVIIKGLSIRQDDRYQSAAEMQKALRKAYNQGRQPLAVAKEAMPVADVDTTEAPTRIVAAEPAQATHVPEKADTGGTTMDSTLRMDDAEVARLLNQSDVKTEVINAGVVDVKESAAEDKPQAAKSAAVPQPLVSAPTPVAVKGRNAPQKAKSSAAGFLIGALIGLVLLGVAAGGAWYAYDRYYSVQTSATMPTPMPAASPTPVATIAVSNTENTNSHAAESNTAEDNSNQAATRNSSTAPAVREAPTTTRTNSAPGRPTQPASPRSTPRARPRDDRTVILQ